MTYSILKSIFFQMDPEAAHYLALSLLRYIPGFIFKKGEGKPIETMGMTFKHPVGLAAGLDKNGAYINALAKLNFSFIEIGTVTPKPQPGNPKPRLFRLPEKCAIINRMGFNNEGVDALVNNVARAQYQGILGINIGKNKDTALARAAEDYLYCLQKVYPYASYITVNVSSPNTPGLRQLQEGHYFSSLLAVISQERIRLADKHKKIVPIVVKISPDENDDTVKKIAHEVVQQKFDGIIATNTTSSRNGVVGLEHCDEAGGLSGAPLAARATKCLQLVKQEVGDAICLIGVGGIDSLNAAQDKLNYGASLVQIYTGLIYQGPGLVPELVDGLDYECLRV